MDMTWRDDGPLAITAASQSEERPSRSMVTMASALSSSSDVTMRFRRSLCGAGLAAFGASVLAVFFGFGLALP